MYKGQWKISRQIGFSLKKISLIEGLTVSIINIKEKEDTIKQG